MSISARTLLSADKSVHGKTRKIIMGIVIVLIFITLIISVKAPATKFPYELKGPYLTECQSLRADAVNNKLSIGAEDYSKIDMDNIKLFMNNFYSEINKADISNLNENDYVLDMWTCVIFTKEQMRNGEILKYRIENGYKK